MKGITDFKGYRTRITFDAKAGVFVNVAEALTEFANEPVEGGKQPCVCQLHKKGDLA